MLALCSLLRGTPNWQEELAAATATTSSMQKRKANKSIVNDENAVPTEIEAAGTSDELPRPLGQKSATRLGRQGQGNSRRGASCQAQGRRVGPDFGGKDNARRHEQARCHSARILHAQTTSNFHALKSGDVEE
uniref:Uncharacterized protein n=1 Tax=Hyaloperonospora arabidopsidis (strain Emoy2) TaxID=559515 RepID=M4C648_HYAAE